MSYLFTSRFVRGPCLRSMGCDGLHGGWYGLSRKHVRLHGMGGSTDTGMGMDMVWTWQARLFLFSHDMAMARRSKSMAMHVRISGITEAA